VGSALIRRLQAEGYAQIITRTHDELDLECQAEVKTFFDDERPEYVFLAAAKVGGILANASSPAEFIYRNLAIQTNVINSAWNSGVRRLLFLGSSCIYPRKCQQPIREDYLLTAPLEPTNEPYAVAKIAGVKMCEAYNRQYGTNFIALMPTNLYGPNDNFDLETSHVLAALIRKFHLAKLAAQGDWNAVERDESRYGKVPESFMCSLVSICRESGRGHCLPTAGLLLPPATPAVPVWGSGFPRREFLHVDDLADACVFMMNLDEKEFRSLVAVHGSPLINIGCGTDVTIRELALLIKEIVGYEGGVTFDHSKPDGTPQKLLDISKASNLGWSPKITLADGIERAYEWYARQGEC
jgi:GDP-L-fucose synthase